MRRAIIQNLRTFRRPNPRKALKQLRTANAYNAALQQQQRSIANRTPGGSQTVQNYMRFTRRVSTPIALVGAGAAAYYVYQQRPAQTLANPSPTPAAFSLAQGVTAPQHGGTAARGTAAPQQASIADASRAVDVLEAQAQLPEAVRKALVVDHGQLYTAELPADQVVSKETDVSGRKVLAMLTPEQASAKLRRNEESYLVGRGEGVVRYDVVQIPSNDPIEDDHVEKIVEVPNTIAAAEDGKTRSDWMFWGVFDGHSGWTTSAKLRQTLVSYVARELNATYKSALADPALTYPTPEAVEQAIKTGFLKLDHEITHDSVKKVLKSQSKTVAAEILAPALSGSCALLSFYDSRSKLLRVACTGDSRAVLGRRSPSNPATWTATPLSTDQTGGTPSEEARLRAEHPNEPYVVSHGRILGNLEPSRAFGDAVYKWSAETQEKMKTQFFGRTPSKLLKTPPYVTAEPVVTTTRVDPAQGDFVVMASDGLWEMLTNEEVVGLVGQWLDKQASSSPTAGRQSPSAGSWLSSWFSSAKSQLPVQHDSAAATSSDPSEGQRAPIRQQQWNIPSSDASRFVVEDKNCATHLVRNALGGKDHDMVSALLTLPAPYSRRFRDDLTVQVIFFGEQQGEGGVELNGEASATVKNAGGVGGEVKAKARL